MARRYQRNPRRRVVRGRSQDELRRGGRRRSEELYPEENFDMPFVRVGGSVVGTAQDVVQRVGDAIIGGDFSGYARGLGALDVQISRAGRIGLLDREEMIASGDASVAFGRNNAAIGDDAVALGVDNVADDYSVAVGSGCTTKWGYAIALGFDATAEGEGALAVGEYAEALKDGSLALGQSAVSRYHGIANIAGAIAVKREDDASSWVRDYSGAEVIVMSGVIDLTDVEDYAADIGFSGYGFVPSECGLIATEVDSVATQPTIRFGIDGDNDMHLAATLTTLLTASGRRERYLPDDFDTVVPDFTFGVTGAAVATVLEGRAYWKGVFVEDEA